MNTPALLSVLSAILLSGCQNMPSPNNLANKFKPSSQQAEIWLDKTGYQPSFKDNTDCKIQAQIATKQITNASGSHTGVLGIIGDMVNEEMENSDQLDNCMLSRGYVKIKAEPGHVYPQRPDAPQYGTNTPSYPPNNSGYPVYQNAPSYAAPAMPSPYPNGNPYPVPNGASYTAPAMPNPYPPGAVYPNVPNPYFNGNPYSRGYSQ